MKSIAAVLSSFSLGTGCAIAIDLAVTAAGEGVPPLITLWSEMLSLLP
ncbi:MAG: hypothetical protein HYX69_09400 [Planctomycetia bacterium]|nr:hypothetical protein [Planctomycetia bacterium]